MANEDQRTAAEWRALLNESPLTVNHVDFKGMNITREEFIKAELKRCGVLDATTFGGVQGSLYRAAAALRDLDIFDAVELNADRSVYGVPGVTDVEVSVREKKRLYLNYQVNKTIQTGDTEMTLGAGLRNAFGRAERLKGSVTYGQLTRSWMLDFHKPRIMDTDRVLTSSLFRTQNVQPAWIGLEEAQRGVTLGLSSYHHPTNSHIVLEYSGIWRDYSPWKQEWEDPDLSKPYKYTGPSSHVIDRCTSSNTKSSISCTVTQNKLDNPSAPKKGTFRRFSLEMAGLGGDVHFLKGTAKLQWWHPLSRLLSIGTGLHVGMIGNPLSFRHSQGQEGVEHCIPIMDLFFMGGPLALRGFKPMGAGPVDMKEQCHFTGGNILTEGSVALAFTPPVSALRENGICFHGFLNYGSLIRSNDIWNGSESSTQRDSSVGVSPFAQAIKSLINVCRATIGFGIVVPTGAGRLEVNYIKHLKVAPTDRLQTVEIGIGATSDFL